MQTQVRQLPPGITPPLVIKYSASSIPVIQLALSSPTLPEQTVFDAAVNQLRPQLVTIPGVAIPFPYGGKNRVISVDLDLPALQARGLAPADVVNAVNTQNLILPSGTAKFGDTEYTRAHERARPTRSPASTTCRCAPAAARRPTCATSPRCATASRRRPTSCARTASAACCSRC